MENRHTPNDLEVRFIAAEDLEIRAEADKPSKLVGYAAVFNSLSADLGNFRERIMSGAFSKSINAGGDIRALVDHDNAKLLGRTSNGTLKLLEDAKGLRVEIDLPDTSYANDLKTLVARKDVRGMSFGFRVDQGGERFVRDGGETIRELTSILLKEVSATPNPAYGDTSLFVRVDPNVAKAAAASQKFLRLEMAKRKLAVA